jgi:hypothetical protein
MPPVDETLDRLREAAIGARSELSPSALVHAGRRDELADTARGFLRQVGR